MTEDTDLSITLGSTYVVYAITFELCYPWYYICDDAYDNIHVAYPIWYPAPLFDLVDGGLSRHWEWNYFLARSGKEYQSIIAFPEWARDPGFYDRLTDLEDEAVSVFGRYKRLIDEEAAQLLADAPE